MDLHWLRTGMRSPAQAATSKVLSFIRCHDRRPVFIVTLFLLLFFMVNPSTLMGESEQTEAAKEHQLSKIRTTLELQSKLSPAACARVAQSIAKTSDKYALDPMLVLAVIQVESRFDHKAVSPSGAQGLMQVQPVAVAAMVQEGKVSAGKARSIKDPPVNVELGVSYLAYLKDLFGDWRVALTAYNSGPSVVSRKIAGRENLGFGYARKVLSARRELNEQLAQHKQVETVSDQTKAAG